ncbi:ABC transporter substrate-binding protein [Sphaerisporangium sp. NPDC051011]|uniref:ABC transporter substrate-binding protein n=1 Tax=Sphaerisporangium sp. NPDC051011 TaxID=3155792 RepID=UPI0033D8FDBC
MPLAWGAGLLTASLALSACAGGTAADDSGSGTFTLAVPVPLPSANPYAVNTGAGQMRYLSYLAYDPLINETKSGEFVSGLASVWKATSTSATFTLRKDVTCSDGEKLTAGQVADALNFVGDPKNQYPWVGGLTPTVAYSVKGDDDAGTLTVTTEQDFPFLLQTLGQVPIVCAPGLKNPSKLDQGTSGTGPFVLESATKNIWTYRVREGYRWGPDGASTSAAGTPHKLVLKIVTDPTTSANELLAGKPHPPRSNSLNALRPAWAVWLDYHMMSMS